MTVEQLQFGQVTGLNEAQQAAVTHGNGPLLIVAGAGTGKTTVLTRRIAHLIATGRAKPEEILALTFTEKAAAEMEGRLSEELPLGRVPEHISTFHSFGDRLLREFSFEVGLPPTFKLLRDLEQVLLLREHLFELPLDFFRPRTAPGRHLKTLAKFFARVKQDDLSAQDYAALVAEESKRVAAMEESPEKADAAYDLGKSEEVSACFLKYEELKADAYGVDQSDQVFMAYRMLRDHEVIRRRVRTRFKYVLVDEFQDVDLVQAKLVDLLAGENGNVTVVGDDDQSIYGFRGASVSNILHFSETHPDTTTVVLTENYRSTQPILDASYRLIQHNGAHRLEARQGINKELHAVRGEGPEPLILRAATAYDEAEAIALRIEEMLRDPELEPQDVAILTRKKDTAEYFRAALLKHGIPAAFDSTGKLYEQHEVKLCLAFLDLVANPRQHGRLRLLATSEIYGVDHDEMAKIEQERRTTQESLWDLLEHLDPTVYTPATLTRAKRLREDVQKFCRLADSLNAAQVLYRWLVEHTSWVQREELSEEDALRTQNLSKLFRRLRTFVENASDPSVGGWVEYFGDILAYGDDQAASETSFEQNAVQLLTAHAAKGLEFEVAFVAGMTRDYFPLSGFGDQIPHNLLPTAHLPENDHVREERRLAYVAMTRAKTRLFLSSAGSYDSSSKVEPSRFVMEAMGDAPVTQLQGGATDDPLRTIHQTRPELALATAWQPPDPLELSYTQIQTYDTCPLKFYWEHVEHVYVEPDPATEYGNLLHAVIAAINQAHMRGKMLSEQEVAELFEDTWGSRRWFYDSADHRDQAKARAKQALLTYRAKESQGEPAFAVEEEFRLTVGGVIIKGRFDRIDKVGDTYTLTDYKSSEVRTRKQAMGRLEKNRQLTLYAMALKERFGVYPKEMSLYFVEHGIVAPTTVSKVKVKNLETKIAQVAEGIRERHFEPKLAQHYCTPTVFNFCPGNMLKPAREM